MAEQEGVIKFQIAYTAAAPLERAVLREINAWRKVCYLAELIGQHPDRYQGYGYGNISRRLQPFDAPPSERPFVVSGTQTGCLAELDETHYAVVCAYYPQENRVVAEGPVRPSSEAMTHGTLYALDAGIRCVIHAHSPHIWRHAAALGIPMTAADVPYGSPEMSAEVERLFRETAVRAQGLLGMGGHEDGVVAFGTTADEAGTRLLRALAHAFQCGTD